MATDLQEEVFAERETAVGSIVAEKLDESRTWGTLSRELEREWRDSWHGHYARRTPKVKLWLLNACKSAAGAKSNQGRRGSHPECHGVNEVVERARVFHAKLASHECGA